MKRLLVVLALCIMPLYAYAQLPLTAEGDVFQQEEGERTPLPSVNVYNQDGAYGTTTNVNGHYSLQVQHGVNHLFIDFRCIGFRNQTKDFGSYVRRARPGATVYFPDVIMESDIVQNIPSAEGDAAGASE